MSIQDYNPNECSLENGNLVGLPFDEQTARVILLPVPWEATVSYSAGTAKAAENIVQASYQLDLYDADVEDAWKLGIYVRPLDKKILEHSNETRKLAKKHIKRIEKREKIDKKELAEINKQCHALKNWVYSQTSEILNAGKLVGLIGGDHSTPLGLLQALGERHSEFGILHIDAHCDLRNAYEGFTYSHASIFYNTLEQVYSARKLVQVGIRDYCQEEVDYIAEQGDRITVFTDQAIKESLYKGKSFHHICEQIIAELPQLVYISFDIDGLDPKLCPNTGTPVAGGFELQEMFYLIKQVVLSGRKIIGFDLSEVGAASEWDGNVGARVLYKLCNLMGHSQELI